MTFTLLVWISLGYVGLLFLVAWTAEYAAARGRARFLRSSLVYTLSLSVYCTAWTFYGAVGSAARSGLEFVAIYIGPTLVFIGWWFTLRKLVRVGRTQRVTSIADFLSSRYGKSRMFGGLVTLLCVAAATPYIALQLQSLTRSVEAVALGLNGPAEVDVSGVGLWLAAGLAAFTIIFGTRSLDASERHTGIVTAIAVEAVVKLLALVSVGVFVVWGVFDGPGGVLGAIDKAGIGGGEVLGGRWATLVFLSAAAVICLPRMFQVMVVENENEAHLATASWAFPAYLFLMSLFVLPIAVAGLVTQPIGSDPDLFVLTVPLLQGQETLAAFAFIGGFSAATSMVIVATIALATMVSNQIVLPLWLNMSEERAPASDDVRGVITSARRFSIVGLLGLGWLYMELSGGRGALASIGLIAFLGVAQILPPLVGGLLWRPATRRGASAGLIAGFAIWAWSLLLPNFGVGGGAPDLLGDPLTTATVLSLTANTGLFVAVSLLTRPSPVEALQAHYFIDEPEPGAGAPGAERTAATEELFVLSQRILGREPARALFEELARRQGKLTGLPDPTEALIVELERRFAGQIGAATAAMMLGRVAQGDELTIEDIITVADETAQIMEYSARVEAQSKTLASTADQLRRANEKLTSLSAQKDAFLSQVSHELRTPMTSIRAFAGFLREGETLAPEQRVRFAEVIHEESIRLTRLLDDILDLSFLENGRVKLDLASVRIGSVMDRATLATETLRAETGAVIRRDLDAEAIETVTDADRLSQVFINLLTNAMKHGAPEKPVLTVSCTAEGAFITIDVADNGPGVPPEKVEVIFEKFEKLSGDRQSGSAGLGLPISREIMRNLGGSLTYRASEDGAVFRVRLPLRPDGVNASERDAKPAPERAA